MIFPYLKFMSVPPCHLECMILLSDWVLSKQLHTWTILALLATVWSIYRTESSLLYWGRLPVEPLYRATWGAKTAWSLAPWLATSTHLPEMTLAQPGGGAVAQLRSPW